MRHNPDDEKCTPYAHTPVLWKEVLSFAGEALKRAGGVLVDCTLGEGGHTELFLESFPAARVVAFERDPEVLTVARERLSRFGDRAELINDNFSRIGSYAGRISGASALLFDYGISSYHFDRSGRGFSLHRGEPLDMRLDPGAERSAAEIVNNFSELELTDIFRRYGEERWAGKIARHICRKRQEQPIETTSQLSALVLEAIPRRFHVKNIHPATRIFQALRIVVNDELRAIEESLNASLALLGEGGIVMAISFHSLEDRIVKNAFREMARGCVCGMGPKRCVCGQKPSVKILTKKPVTPSQEEVAVNKRSRSAKLRVCEKIAVSE